jgi:tetratricopeptide (TPR) repeat protein
VAEEAEGLDTGAPASAAGVDPAALALGLAGADRDKANAYLDDQRALVADQRKLVQLQAKELAHELKLRHWSLQLRHASAILKLALEVSAAVVGVAIAAALAWLVWNAANSNDLVIDAFAVPPDLAARGLSGPVVAAKLSDRIAAMQAQTRSARAPKSYANGLSDGLKLEIPETGVSLSELDRFLREKLGHDQHIGGEMVEISKGIALTARVGTDGSPTVTGAEADMDAMLQRLAEQVYRTTQPYRYAVWLQIQNRNEESIAILKPLAASGGAGERVWAYNGWAVNTIQQESERAGLALLRRGLALDPNHYLLTSNIAGSENRLGREEDSLRDVQAALALVAAHGRDYTLPDRIASAEHAFRSAIFRHQGALLEALEQNRLNMEAVAAGAVNLSGVMSVRANILAGLHEPAAARATLAERPPIMAGGNNLPADVPSLTIALAAQDWPAVLAAEKDFASMAALFPGYLQDKATMADPPVALALAHLGQFAAAEARLKDMPADCYLCLRARAQVAALQGQGGRADYWFAHAVAIGPSLPFAESEWGQALLDRGQPDGAIAKFKLSNQKGPHFADPLEGWGEALMAKNQSHLALAKFEEADKYAPNWGRLHLKWGEALAYAGKRDDAKTQFARAEQLDMTPSEKAELRQDLLMHLVQAGGFT